VTIGESGLGALFADTVKELSASNSAALESAIRGSVTNDTLPNPVTDVQPEPDAAPLDPETKKKFIIAVAASLAAALIWWFVRRK
jgi:hypothetical protein